MQVLRGKVNKMGKQGITCLICPSAILKYTRDSKLHILTKDYGVSGFKNTHNLNVSQNWTIFVNMETYKDLST